MEAGGVHQFGFVHDLREELVPLGTLLAQELAKRGIEQPALPPIVEGEIEDAG